MTQCCCGRYQLSEPLIVNDKRHEPLDFEGAFCGPEINHRLRDAEKRVEKLTEILGWCFEYLDAIPKDITFPVMPGFDRDYANEVYNERLHQTATCTTTAPLVG